VAKRSKSDKKRSKRRDVIKRQRYQRRKVVEGFFRLIGDFPYDMRLELKKAINKHPYNNKEWKRLDSNTQNYEIDNLSMMVTDQNAFSKYFPWITVYWRIYNNQCIISPCKLDRVFLSNYTYYVLPIRLPTCDHKTIVFSKHALERYAERFINFYDIDIKPSVSSFILNRIIIFFVKSKNKIVYHKKQACLYCSGVACMDGEFSYLGRGIFPLVLEHEYAVAKTFLLDEPD